MYRSKFRSLHIDNNSIASSTQDEDSADTLLDSATTLLRMPSKAPKRSWFTTSRTLRLSSLILHSALVAIHLALVGIWARGLEHRFTVALENEKFVSFLISATTTAFGTIYSALLVFATQTLSMRRSLQMDQVLTATHDNAAAWAGVGAAISYLWSQKTVPARASMIGVLTAALYLTTILGLHITTSSLFSLCDKPRLHEGTLYDVLNIDAILGNATVDASGFNVTCGYVLDVAGLQSSDSNWWESADRQYAIPVTHRARHDFDSAKFSQCLHHSLQHHSDRRFQSQNWTNGESHSTDDYLRSSIQIFQCSLSLVNQTATVDAQSRQFQALGPGFKKAASTWVPYTQFVIHSHSRAVLTALVGDMVPYLIQKLNLPAANHNSIMNVTLHEVENALSIIVASMFWTLGHIPPSHRAISSSIRGLANGTSQDSLSDVPKSPILLQGNANVTEIFAQARLELSIIAGSTDDKNLSVNGTGILHAIWLYRNHPELETLLEQVEHPTDDNLRAAGLVQTRLVGEHVQKEGEMNYFK
ncbi:hypothetical protein B0H13DRAFT_2477681 [Mycena leptocephala]|nr:hypothetical protein B0H13DRAFT_2477681 [Mycena leptocephala]